MSGTLLRTYGFAAEAGDTSTQVVMHAIAISALLDDRGVVPGKGIDALLLGHSSICALPALIATILEYTADGLRIRKSRRNVRRLRCFPLGMYQTPDK